ncbi:MAG: anthranilate phosphoribosyltransferase [Flavobacteriales bacterium]|nr:anthranilate phosphoribosyltransferase [Flavobacteriales bacterium]|tara:strand:+ start:823 stop:1806 length:984 start_codon:yes stop_codon:yes gene_type:complete
MKTVLKELFKGKRLSFQESKDALLEVGKGNINNSLISSFLTVFMMRNIEGEELEGFRAAMLELCNPVNLGEIKTIDMCGTGGDGKNTFNVSTTSSFVVAASGIKVAKHGNYGVSSGVGSSNVIEHLGYHFKGDEKTLKSEIQNSGITFFHAPLFHPAMRFVGPVRKELGLKTFFNMIGPLVNPSKPNYQLTGVYDPSILPLYNHVLSNNLERYAILHSEDVYDEISLTSDFYIYSHNGVEKLSPSDLRLSKLKPEEIGGGDSVDYAARVLTNVLSGKGTKAQQEVVAANAGVAISVAKDVKLHEGVEEALDIINEGKAIDVLHRLIK